MVNSNAAVFTMKFKTFAAAHDFVTKAGALVGHARPYKRNTWVDGCQIAIWCVTMPAPKLSA
jgi:hypothetical protein